MELSPTILDIARVHEEFNHSLKPNAGVEPLLSDALFGMVTHGKAMPVQTAVFGYCEDGLPLLLDLKNSSPGAILAIAESEDSLRMLLKQVAVSAMENSPANLMEFIVVTDHQDEWNKFMLEKPEQKHCLGICSPFEPSGREAIIWAAQLGNERVLGRQLDPPLLLLLDDIGFIDEMDFDVQVYLRWLLNRGPDHYIWLIATLVQTGQSSVLPWIRRFQTRIWGKMDDAFALKVENDDGLNPARLDLVGHFSVRVQDKWCSFRVDTKGR